MRVLWGGGGVVLQNDVIISAAFILIDWVNNYIRIGSNHDP